MANDYLVALRLSPMLSRRRIKCCIIGDYNVGKTSIMYSFLDKPLDNVRSTLGIDFFSKTVTVADRDVYLSLWDTAGAEKYRSLMHSYLRDAEVIIVVYDTSAQRSNIVHWMRIAEQHSARVVGVLGNKSDLTTALKDDIEELLFPWSRQNRTIVTGTCSSRRPAEVKSFFKKCLRQVLDNMNTAPISITVPLNPKTRQNHKCCT